MAADNIIKVEVYRAKTQEVYVRIIILRKASVVTSRSVDEIAEIGVEPENFDKSVRRLSMFLRTWFDDASFHEDHKLPSAKTRKIDSKILFIAKQLYEEMLATEQKEVAA